MGNSRTFPAELLLSARPPSPAASHSVSTAMLKQLLKRPPPIHWPPALGPTPQASTLRVEISLKQITLIAQHADISQGAGSAPVALIAEEMDLDLGQFEIRFAGPSPAYFNTGFAEEFEPFAAADQSPAAEKAREATLEWLRKSGLQMTGGSSTILDTYEKLRVAGAVARETLKAQPPTRRRCGRRPFAPIAAT